MSEIVERYAETRRINTLLEAVKKLMKNASFTLDQAFNNLEVSDKDRLIITKALQEGCTMKKFTIRLNNVKNSYYSFVVAVLTYVKNKPSRLPIVEKFLDEHSDASTSDILEFISDQPDFYEDAAYNQPEVSCHGFQTSGRESSSTATSSNERKKRRIKDMAGKYDFDEEIIESLRMKSLI